MMMISKTIIMAAAGFSAVTAVQVKSAVEQPKISATHGSEKIRVVPIPRMDRSLALLSSKHNNSNGHVLCCQCQQLKFTSSPDHPLNLASCPDHQLTFTVDSGVKLFRVCESCWDEDKDTVRVYESFNVIRTFGRWDPRYVLELSGNDQETIRKDLSAKDLRRMFGKTIKLPEPLWCRPKKTAKRRFEYLETFFAGLNSKSDEAASEPVVAEDIAEEVVEPVAQPNLEMLRAQHRERTVAQAQAANRRFVESADADYQDTEFWMRFQFFKQFYTEMKKDYGKCEAIAKELKSGDASGFLREENVVESLRQYTKRLRFPDYVSETEARPQSMGLWFSQCLEDEDVTASLFALIRKGTEAYRSLTKKEHALRQRALYTLTDGETGFVLESHAKVNYDCYNFIEWLAQSNKSEAKDLLCEQVFKPFHKKSKGVVGTIKDNTNPKQGWKSTTLVKKDHFDNLPKNVFGKKLELEEANGQKEVYYLRKASDGMARYLSKKMFDKALKANKDANLTHVYGAARECRLEKSGDAEFEKELSWERLTLDTEVVFYNDILIIDACKYAQQVLDGDKDILERLRRIVLRRAAEESADSIRGNTIVDHLSALRGHTVYDVNQSQTSEDDRQEYNDPSIEQPCMESTDSEDQESLFVYEFPDGTKTTNIKGHSLVGGNCESRNDFDRQSDEARREKQRYVEGILKRTGGDMGGTPFECASAQWDLFSNIDSVA